MKIEPSPESTSRISQIAFALAVIYSFSVYGPMAAMSIAAGLLFVGWLATGRGRALGELRSVTKSPIFWPTIFLSLACFLSLLWADVSNLEFLGARPNIEWAKDLRKLWHLFFTFILAALLSRLSHGTLRRVCKLWLIAGFLSAVLGVIQHWFPIYKPMELPDPGLRGLYHATGFSGFHLSYAATMGFPLATWFAVFAAFAKRRALNRASLPGFAGLFAGLLVFLLAAVFSYSKTNWMAVPLTILVLTMVGLKGRVRWALASVLVLSAAAFSQTSIVLERFRGLRTINDRLLLWNANFEMIKEFPLLGVGWHHNSELSEAYYNSYGVKSFFEGVQTDIFVSHAHNNIIDQWASTGTIGLSAFLAWNIVLLWMAYKVYKYKRDDRFFFRSMGLGVLGGWLCLHINGLTQTNFWDAKVLHQISWVSAMVIEMYRRTREES